MKITFEVCKLTANIILPEKPSGKIVYLHCQGSELPEIYSQIGGSGVTLSGISGADWNNDLSPWSAKKVFHGGEDFGGRAKEHLNLIESRLIPAAEGKIGFVPESRGIAGYSLAGLFAVWALWQTDVFDSVSSVSGSLWFDGFADYAKENAVRAKLKSAYFSVGKREKETKNARMSEVESCTQRVFETVKSVCPRTVFELNEGGHFNDAEKRTARGIAFIGG